MRRVTKVNLKELSPLLISLAEQVKMASSAVLSNGSILQRVFSLVGPGEWAFYSTVSKLWVEMYRLVPT
jgi:hypothetical protein